MRRLFSTFARGPPGIGLLLLRLITGVAAMAPGIATLGSGDPSMESVFLATFLIGMGLLLVAGFLTPIACAMIAVTAAWNAISHPADRWYCVMLAALGTAVALIGPGAWSVDARLFGWKRF